MIDKQAVVMLMVEYQYTRIMIITTIMNVVISKTTHWCCKIICTITAVYIIMI